MDKIDELLTRGVENIIPNKNELEKVLRSNKKLNIYLGIDPTAIHIHLGHAVPLRKLQAFVELGHNVTFLIGDFTALIGDTSDKDSERPILTKEEIQKNFQTYKTQAEKILDFSKVNLRHNSEWLSKLTYEEVIKLFRHFSLNDFISRELIKKRLTTGGHVRFDEVSYPVMQGYDSYFMDTDLQIGGTDQTFNMQAGRTLQKDLRGKESFILATGFLEGTDARKMSKSWGNAIWLDDKPTEIFGKVMSLRDELIIQYFTLATNLPLEEIAQKKKTLSSGENPMILKKELAHQIVSELYNKNEAKKAQEEFERVHQQRQNPLDFEIKVYKLKGGTNNIVDILVNSKLVDSRSEAKRLVEQRGVEIDGKKLETRNSKLEINDESIIKVGKNRFVKIKL